MRTTRTCGRQVSCALVLGSLTMLAAPGADACESDYHVRSGDTLSEIAAKCDTTVAALAEANEVDPRFLQLGDVLNIPSREKGAKPVARESSRTRSAEADVAEDAAGYTIRPGDTPTRIAAELGIPLDTLLAANEGIDTRSLRIGQKLNVPDSEEVSAILEERNKMMAAVREHSDPRLALSKGGWRLTVDIEADGLAPDEPVQVAVSGDGRDWIELGEMPADEAGYLIARARIPAELVDSATLQFAIERVTGDRLSAEYAAGSAIAGLERSGQEPGTVEVAGKLVRGGGCSLLITRDGETYALTGMRGNISTGSEVLVSGVTNARSPECVGHEALEVQTVAALTQG